MPRLVFNQTFSPHHGEAVPVSDDVVRITANNPSAFTFHGTNSYLIGKDNLALIDPGPDDDDHLTALLNAIGDRKLSHIFISHTHKDHSSLAYRLQDKTGAQLYAEGKHRPARDLLSGESNPLEDSSDGKFEPDIYLPDGAIIDGGDWSLEAIHTPGHTANHCAFYCPEADILFSADHVMAWSTSIVAPPDGAMRDYLHSLDRLIAREHSHILPGHGPKVTDPRTFLPALKEHRLARERDILTLIQTSPDITIPDIVAQLYQGLAANLMGAAALSVFAHIEDLAGRDLIYCDGPLSIDGRYRAA